MSRLGSTWPGLGVRDTSLDAYQDLRATGAIGAQAQSIVQFISQRGGDWSLQEISQAMRLPINVVSGRCNDAKKSGRLEESEKRKCRVTQRTIHPVRLKQGQLGLFRSVK